jgi:cytochrome c
MPDTRRPDLGALRRLGFRSLHFWAHMHDDLRWNKLFGAILATGLAILLLRQGSEMFFAPGKYPAKPGDAVTIQEATTGGDDAKPDSPPDWGTVLAKADVAAGQATSSKCQSCHNFANGGPNQTGPNLWGVIGRKPASHPGFAYSQGMQDFGAKTPVWDLDHIYMFLGGPQAYVSGT